MTFTPPSDLTRTVNDAIGPGVDPRLRELMSTLTGHLHAFVRETQLTLPELLAACRFLVRAGKISDGARDEFVLIANLLGVEVLIDQISHAGNPQSTVLGPMYRPDAPWCEYGESIVRKMPADGRLTLVEGTVRGPNGAPLAGATVEVWEPTTSGLYENQDPEQPDMNLRGRFKTDDEGRYALRCLRPTNYPVPDDGPGGDLLKILGRHPTRAAHIHFLISAPGHEALIAQLYDAGDPYKDNDSIFAVKDALVAEFEPAPAGLDVDYVVRYDWLLGAAAGAQAA